MTFLACRTHLLIIIPIIKRNFLHEIGKVSPQHLIFIIWINFRMLKYLSDNYPLTKSEKDLVSADG